MALATAAALASAAAAPPLFEQLRWTAPGSELEVLSSQPYTCIQYRPNLKRSFEEGRALFNTPTLLGGQAAKAGLSCESCHVSGRDSPHFQMAGVSDKPGTADVTHSYFSAARGNGRFDPVPIPDLAMQGKVSRGQGEQALEKFIRNLIVEEFAGEEPSDTMLESLATYVRAIRVCEPVDKLPTPRGINDQLQIISGALNVAPGLFEKGNNREAALMIAAARHQLSLISERYARPGLKRERQALLKASRELQQLADVSIASEGRALAIAQWKRRFDNGLGKRLLNREAASLYDHARLAAAIKEHK